MAIGFTTRALTKKTGRLRAIANDMVESTYEVLLDHAKNTILPRLDSRIYASVKQVINKNGKGQRYQRTYNLGTGWRVLSFGDAALRAMMVAPSSSFNMFSQTAGRALSVSIVNDVRDEGTAGGGYRYYVKGYPEAQGYTGEPYANLVQSEGEQRPIHRGRWPTYQQVQRETSRTLQGKLHAAANAAARRH